MATVGASCSAIKITMMKQENVKKMTNLKILKALL